MGTDERNDLAACADCGMPVGAEEERVYAFGTESILCASCALRRGGAYDEERDRWVTPPAVDDLLALYESHL